MVQYYAYHKIKQDATGGTSSKRDAILLVVEDILCWWSRTGIKLKAHDTIVKMIQFLLKNYRTLQITKNREGKAKNDRDHFKNDIKNTFWIITKDTEDILRNSTDVKNREDWLYLEKVRGRKREATLGCMDKQVQNTMARKRARKEQRDRTAMKKINVSSVEHDIELSSSSEEDIDHHDPDIKYNFKAKTPKIPKITKKKQVITPEVCAVALKYNRSNRDVCEMIGASTSHINSKDKILSVNTVSRRKLDFTMKTSEKIFSEELSRPSTHYTLHWDSKKFKATQHSKKSEDRLAVIITTSDGSEILLGIMPVANGTAAEEHKIILGLLAEKQIPLDKIVAGVFDTTSVNTGELNGIVRRLESSLGHPILELACRHHIYELVCGASSEIALGKKQEGRTKKTTSPYEPLFIKLKNSWENIDKENKATFEETSYSRSLIRHIHEAKEFLYKWLDNEKTQREDYQEMAKLCLIYLGGNLPKKMSKFKFRAPGAYHHARWMSKVIYVLKLAMLKPHFVDDIVIIRSLGLFYSVYYAKAWLTCIFPSEAPFQDLSCLKALEEVSCAKGLWPEGFQIMAKTALGKLKDHTWYLSERLVGLALFSDKVDIATKETMRIAILKHDKKPMHSEQQRPECSSFSKRQLKDFVGPDTHLLFNLLSLKKEILSIPANKWNSSLLYQHNRNIIKHLPVVNDTAERALGMATSMHGSNMPKNEKQCQASFKVVHKLRKAQGTLAKSSERVTKYNLNKFLNNNS